MDYRNQKDMMSLAIQVRAIPIYREVEAVTYIYDHGLMKVQWWLRLLLKFVKKKYGTTALAWQILDERDPTFCRTFLYGTAEHIMTGRDKTTKDAYGGFNQNEVNLMSAYLQFVNV